MIVTADEQIAFTFKTLIEERMEHCRTPDNTLTETAVSIRKF